LITASQESYVTATSGEVASIIRVGLGDHLHCALLRQRGRRSEAGVDKLPMEFRELIPIVHQHVPADLPLVLAHECRYHGRNFVHLTFQNRRTLLSLVIARKQDGESLDGANLLPAACWLRLLLPSRISSTRWWLNVLLPCLTPRQDRAFIMRSNRDRT